MLLTKEAADLDEAARAQKGQGVGLQPRSSWTGSNKQVVELILLLPPTASEPQAKSGSPEEPSKGSVGERSLLEAWRCPIRRQGHRLDDPRTQGPEHRFVSNCKPAVLNLWYLLQSLD